MAERASILPPRDSGLDQWDLKVRVASQYSEKSESSLVGGDSLAARAVLPAHLTTARGWKRTGTGTLELKSIKGQVRNSVTSASRERRTHSVILCLLRIHYANSRAKY